MESTFRETLTDMGIYIKRTINSYLDIDIYGYEKNTYYQEFRLYEHQEMDFEEFSILDRISFGTYGFIDENEYNYGWICTQVETAQFSIESVNVDSFKKEVTFVYLITGEPGYLYNLALDYTFYVELHVEGCKEGLHFWEQSLYLSYLMYKNNNFLGSFMHLFIAFEGLLRCLTEDTKTQDLNKIYKKHTLNNLSSKLKEYKKIRNKVMHGNESAIANLTDNDLEILLEEIAFLYR
ncbi:hypothetical protein [Lysinibacillus sp. NPDC047702]|uniref:hypothetical protein n=1 Tax=unclassified Lysinibacillus TaxID=2636778 RepID=UPI003D00ACEC